MKSRNFKLELISSSAAILAAISLTSPNLTVNAQEDVVTNPPADQQPIESTSTTEKDQVTAEDLNVQEGVVELAEGIMKKDAELLESAENAYEDAQNQVETATGIVEKAEQYLTEVQEIADQATPENIEKLSQSIEDKKQAVTDAQQAVTDAQKDVTNQQKVLDQANQDVQREEQEVAAAKQRVEDAIAAFDSQALTNAINAEEYLTKQIQSDEKAITDLTEKERLALAAQSTLISNGNARRSELEQAVRGAGPEYLTEVIQHEVQKNEVPDGETSTETSTGRIVNEDVIFDGERTETIVIPNSNYYNNYN